MKFAALACTLGEVRATRLPRTWLGALLALSIVLPGAAAPETPSDLVVILDASGSMWGQLEGENKIVIARRVLGELIDGLAGEEAPEVALVAYGHRREGDCADIEAVRPFGPIDPTGLKQQIQQLNPKGKTPITAAVREAFALLEGRDRGSTTVVLVTDGLETCAGDPCAAVRAAARAGSEFVMHVIGFDVAGEDLSSLECMAQAGGGLFLPAEDASELAAALTTAVEASAEEIPDGGLSVKVTANGALHDALVEVKDLATGDAAGDGRTYRGPETNPRIIPLADGRYAVAVAAVGLTGDVRREFEVEVEDGARIERELDFSAGTLAVGVTRNDEPSDATYSVRVAGDSEQVARGRTYTTERTNPAKVSITAGTYEVEVRSVELSGDQRALLGPVVVPPGGSASVAHGWSSGTLRLGAEAGGALVDATLRVYDEAGRSAGNGRTYTNPKSNPKELIVLPGEYRVVVQRIRGPKQEIRVQVGAGQVVEQTVQFEEE